MKQILKKFLIIALILMTVFSLCIPGAFAAEDNRVSLNFIKKGSERRAYMEMMIEYYLDTYPELTKTLKDKKPVIMMFEGGSDTVEDSNYKDVNAKHAAAVCIVLRYDKNNKPYVDFYNEYSATIPDAPLAYGAYDHGKGSQYGTATIKDGIYSFYTTNHKGSYAGFNVRDSKDDSAISSIYMKSDGYKVMNSSGINIHTRTTSKTGKSKPWSAGCLLVGANADFKSYNTFIEKTKPSGSSVSKVTSDYNSNKIYKFAKKGAYSGKVVVDRYLYRGVMAKKIYKDQKAVNEITKFSVNAYKAATACKHPKYNSKGFCASCGKEFQLTLTSVNDRYLTSKTNVITKSQPYSAAATKKTLKTKGTVVKVTASAKNAFGNLWYQLSDGSWAYSEHITKCAHKAYDGSGYCKVCKADYKLKLTKLSEVYVTAKDNVPIRKRPYSSDAVIKKLKKGTQITVAASAKNASGNLWYQLSDGTWVYSGNVKKLPSTLAVKMTKFPSTLTKGKTFNLEGTVSSNYKITSVTGEVYNASNKKVLSAKDAPDAKKLTVKSSKINKNLSFGKLAKGKYKLIITAKDSSGQIITWGCYFTVK